MMSTCTLNRNKICNRNPKLQNMLKKLANKGLLLSLSSLSSKYLFALESSSSIACLILHQTLQPLFSAKLLLLLFLLQQLGCLFTSCGQESSRTDMDNLRTVSWGTLFVGCIFPWQSFIVFALVSISHLKSISKKVL